MAADMGPTIIFQGREASLLELALFAELAHGPRSASSLAERLSLQPDKAQVLFDGLVDGGLLERRGGQYRNSAAVERALEQASESVIGAHARKRRWGLASLVAVLVALFAVQQFGLPRSRPTSAVPVRAVLHISADGKPKTVPAAAGSQPGEALTYYVVSSPEQAALVASQWPADTRDMLQQECVALVTPQEEAGFERATQELDDMRTVLGQPPVRIIDLRAPAH